MQVNKSILIECTDMREEVKDLRHRIEKLQKCIEKLSAVSDGVTGTRKDGTFGNIKITGYPTPVFYQKKARLGELNALLDLKELELLEILVLAEQYIETIKKSEMRIMLRLYYMDDLTWVQVAHKMNTMFPRRRIKYTEDNCRIRNNRFFEES